MLVLIGVLLVVVCQGIQFDFGLEKRELRCFGDNLAKNVMVVGKVEGSSPEYSFKIHVSHNAKYFKMPNRKMDNILFYSNS